MSFLECEAEAIAGARALYLEACPLRHYIILAVLEAQQRGRVFVDRLEAPRVSFVVNRFGFCQLFGSETPAFRDELGARLSAEQGLGAKYLLWYSPPESWAGKLDILVPQPVRRRERIRFVFEAKLASYVPAEERPPDGFTLRTLSSELLPRTQPLKLDIESRFWPSAEAFLANGFGTALVRGDEIASVCYSACVADGHAEVDIATAPEYRGKGFAGVVGRAFVRACLQKGITPAWDAFSENQGSVRLAQALGFRPAARYDFYTFAPPLALPPAGARD